MSRHPLVQILCSFDTASHYLMLKFENYSDKMSSIYDFTAVDIDGNEVNICFCVGAILRYPLNQCSGSGRFWSPGSVSCIKTDPDP